ncbi:hypothetical protein Q8A73_011118 [Channa argus]|nr:hypothetical protein Q8A73_011118 [Channa argus]
MRPGVRRQRAAVVQAVPCRPEAANMHVGQIICVALPWGNCTPPPPLLWVEMAFRKYEVNVVTVEGIFFRGIIETDTVHCQEARPSGSAVVPSWVFAAAA